MGTKDTKEDNKIHTEESDYFFIQEKIKERPIDKRKLLRRLILTAGAAIVFGIVACLTIMLIEPFLGNIIGNDDNEVELEKIVLEEEKPEETDSEDVIVSITDTPFEETYYEETPIEDMNLYDTVSDNQPMQVVIEEKDIELDDYQLLYRKMYLLSQEVQKSMVTVTAQTDDADILSAGVLSTNRTTGLIIGDNGIDLMILADGRNISSDGKITVTFCNGEICSAKLQAMDPDTKLAVYKVSLASISLDTKAQYTIATLGSSYSTILPGSAIIAVGNPIGTTSSICYGAITSSDTRVSMEDAYYQVLTTDIYGSTSGYGFLVNVRGQIIGIITPDNHSEDMKNLVYAYGISSIRLLAQDLSNDAKTVKLGLYVSDITGVGANVSAPVGAYVLKTEPGSPAMNVGISSGDIIVSINNDTISSVSDYLTAIRQYSEGDTIKITLERLSGGEYKEMEVEVTLS